MDVKNSNNPNSLSINAGSVSARGQGANGRSGQNNKNLFSGKNSLIERLNAIDERYLYKSSLTELFNQMDANAIR